MSTVEVDGRSIDISRPDKVLFPDAGITKGDLAEYYQRVAPDLVPHSRGRPVTMHRFPDGIGSGGFYQQRAPEHFPSWVRTEAVPARDGEVRHVLIDDAATLVYLADQACITPHVWLSTVDDLRRPDRMILDLDPPPAGGVGLIRSAARTVRGVLDEAGLRSRIMTTGSAGFHVIVPLRPEEEYDEVRRAAVALARRAVERDPDHLTVEQRRDKRGGRVFLDYLRNAYGQTSVAPYAVRAIPGAPVATPIDWDELGGVEPRTYRIDNLFRRLGQKEDPWRADGIEPQSLPDIGDPDQA